MKSTRTTYTPLIAISSFLALPSCDSTAPTISGAKTGSTVTGSAVATNLSSLQQRDPAHGRGNSCRTPGVGSAKARCYTEAEKVYQACVRNGGGTRCQAIKQEDLEACLGGIAGDGC